MRLQSRNSREGKFVGRTDQLVERLHYGIITPSVVSFSHNPKNRRQRKAVVISNRRFFNEGNRET